VVDEKAIRRAAVTARITTITTLSAARAAAEGLRRCSVEKCGTGTPASARRAGGGEAAVSVSQVRSGNDGSVVLSLPLLVGIFVYGPFSSTCFCTGDPVGISDSCRIRGLGAYQYQISNAPPLPREGKYQLVRLDRNGTAQTSSHLPEGWAMTSTSTSRYRGAGASNAGCARRMIWGRASAKTKLRRISEILRGDEDPSFGWRSIAGEPTVLRLEGVPPSSGVKRKKSGARAPGRLAARQGLDLAHLLPRPTRRVGHRQGTGSIPASTVSRKAILRMPLHKPVRRVAPAPITPANQQSWSATDQTANQHARASPPATSIWSPTVVDLPP